jgi:hypothetical protein
MEITGTTNETPSQKPRNKYDWDKFFNGKRWELIPGEDFIEGTRAFTLRTAALMAASRRGVKVVVGKTPDRKSIWVQRIE